MLTAMMVSEVSNWTLHSRYFTWHLTVLHFDMNGAIIYFSIFFLKLFLPGTFFVCAPGINSRAIGFFSHASVHQLQNIFTVIFESYDQIINPKNNYKKCDELTPGNLFKHIYLID
jgi:hypothetical protein